MTGKLWVKGGWEVSLAGAGEEDAELISGFSVLKNGLSSFALSSFHLSDPPPA